MSKQSNKKETLADLIAKKNSRKQKTPIRGEFYSKTEDYTFSFKKCDEELFFYLMDKFPNGFAEKNVNTAELVKAFNNLIYECVVIENKSLKDKDVRAMLGVDENDKQNLIDNSAKALIESFTDRLNLGAAILEFSGLSNGDKQAKKIKN